MKNENLNMQQIYEIQSEQEKKLGYPLRVAVPPKMVHWNVYFPDYNPPNYTFVRPGKENIADPLNPRDISSETWEEREKTYLNNCPNENDKKIVFDDRGRPLNPKGRTGIEGRGTWEKWGPNPCADPIVLRKNTAGVWELLVVIRKDSGDIALPGGKIDIDKKELADICAQRETEEETGLKIDFTGAKSMPWGYIADNRETDNAWPTTTGVIKVLDSEEIEKLGQPHGSTDAKEAKWIIITDEILEKLYAEHGKMVSKALELLKN